MMNKKYIAVRAEHKSVCDSLKWTWFAIKPLVLEQSDTDKEKLLEEVCKHFKLKAEEVFIKENEDEQSSGS